jgi:hypothetical protein
MVTGTGSFGLRRDAGIPVAVIKWLTGIASLYSHGGKGNAQCTVCREHTLDYGGRECKHRDNNHKGHAT